MFKWKLLSNLGEEETTEYFQQERRLDAGVYLTGPVVTLPHKRRCKLLNIQTSEHALSQGLEL